MFFSNYSRKTDEELMRLVQHGNQQALTVLYNRYSQKMVRYFFRMLWKDNAKAQDFLQDLFLKVIEAQETYNTTRRFSTWLYSVANNMCKNEYRKQSFRQAVHEHKGYEVIGERFLDEAGDRQELLEVAVNQLDVEEKNLYALRFELEMPIEEMSNALGCPEGTVKSRLYHLKKKLAMSIQNEQQVRKTI